MHNHVPDGDSSGLDAARAIQVVLAEREARDRNWWDRMERCFHADSHVELSWFSGTGAEFTRRSIEMSARGVASRHRLGPPTVRVAADRAVVALPAAVETYPVVDDVECVLTAHCRLLYRVRDDYGAVGISRMEVVYERDELNPAVPGQHVAVDPTELADLRPPYRLLAWSLARSGYRIGQDLPADDRPEQVATLYADAFDWAGVEKP
ncbi:hypothetical protein NONO_c37910 [Nocardia nova SH22a]|uniref:SnoaL-like domain-containing protein n=1 Tax=Nocardia nova SH22a TaxID=1415166 RepID=W5TGT1_9NOCA|nr:nuclear transport factor 2 family protein [Nocardia nova]AHH18575.1 hypothetical protein NONO_c37910 [Nocardia nova SH22a]